MAKSAIGNRDEAEKGGRIPAYTQGSLLGYSGFTLGALKTTLAKMPQWYFFETYVDSYCLLGFGLCTASGIYAKRRGFVHSEWNLSDVEASPMWMDLCRVL